MKSDKIKVLIVENNTDLCNLLQTLINSQADMEVVATANDGMEALNLVKGALPDVMLLDLIMPYLDGMGVLTALNEMALAKKPRVIVLSAFEEQAVISNSSRLGADYYILKPFDQEVLLNRIRQVISAMGFLPNIKYEIPINLKDKNSSKFTRSRLGPYDLDNEVRKRLHALGVPTYFKGYVYLKEAIIDATNDVALLNSVTKSLYPRIAQKFSTTVLIIEAAIRYTIHKTWAQGDRDKIAKMFGYAIKLRDGKPPTNSFFIGKISELLRIEMAENTKVL